VYTYSLSYSGGRDRKNSVGGQTGQKLARCSLKKKPGMLQHAFNPSYLKGRNRRIAVPGKSERSYLKNKLKRKDWRCGSSGRAFA
jgi:hypothetical protein